MLECLLSFDPAQRITVEEALAHEYVSVYHDSDDEPVHVRLFDFKFEAVESVDEMKEMIADEIVQFKKHNQGLLDNLPRPKESYYMH